MIIRPTRPRTFPKARTRFTTKVATSDVDIAIGGDALPVFSINVRNRMAHGHLIFDETFERTGDVEVAPINKRCTIKEATDVRFNSKPAGAPVMGHNNTDTVHVKEKGATARNAFGHLIDLAV